MKKGESFRCHYLLLLTLIIALELVLAAGNGGELWRRSNRQCRSKLFVFGDSYVDTGNTSPYNSLSWRKPYGMTTPGFPTGRYSDGRLLTDYIVPYFGTKSLVNYEWRSKEKGGKKIYGMNFAFAGAAVFEGLLVAPNLRTQIDSFQRILEEEPLYKERGALINSVALVSVGSNDYARYIGQNLPTQGIKAFANSVVQQLGLDLKRIHDLGVSTTLIANLDPQGCTPFFTAPSKFHNCSVYGAGITNLHNQLLQQTVQKLESQNKNRGFVILDLFNAFTTAFQSQKAFMKVESLLKPCCGGVTLKDFCGNVGYTLCKDPHKAFFWDGAHPTQATWDAVFSTLQPSLHNLC